MTKHARIKIVSDGTPHGTSVWADGKQLMTTKVAFEIGMDGPAKATIEIYADDIHIEGMTFTEFGYVKTS